MRKNMRVIYLHGTYTQYMSIVYGTLLDKVAISDDVFKNLELEEIKELLETSILPILDIEARVEINESRTELIVTDHPKSAISMLKVKKVSIERDVL